MGRCDHAARLRLHRVLLARRAPDPVPSQWSLRMRGVLRRVFGSSRVAARAARDAAAAAAVAEEKEEAHRVREAAAALQHVGRASMLCVDDTAP